MKKIPLGKHDYTVTGLKTWNTHDGGGWQLTLRRNGRPVAEVTNDGHGGCLDYRWMDKTPATVNTLNYKDEPHSYQGTVEEALLHEAVLRVPPYQSQFDEEGKLSRVNDEIFVEELFNDAIVEKDVKKLLKRVTLLKGNEVLQFKAGVPLDERLRAQIAVKYAGWTILNDLSFADAVSAYVNAQ